MVLVVFGVGAIIGDGVLTPAMSVLSSIEGLHQVAHISQGNHIDLACHSSMLTLSLPVSLLHQDASNCKHHLAGSHQEADIYVASS